MLGTRAARVVPLGSLATFDATESRLSLERENQQQMVAMTADVAGRSLGGLMGDVRRVLGTHPPPVGVRVVLGGRDIEIEELCLVDGKIEGLGFLADAVQVDDLGRALTEVETPSGAVLHIIPGLIARGALPEVMRGEETQVAGSLSVTAAVISSSANPSSTA